VGFEFLVTGCTLSPERVEKSPASQSEGLRAAGRFSLRANSTLRFRRLSIEPATALRAVNNLNLFADYQTCSGVFNNGSPPQKTRERANEIARLSQWTTLRYR